MQVIIIEFEFTFTSMTCEIRSFKKTMLEKEVGIGAN